MCQPLCAAGWLVGYFNVQHGVFEFPSPLLSFVSATSTNMLVYFVRVSREQTHIFQHVRFFQLRGATNLGFMNSRLPSYV